MANQPAPLDLDKLWEDLLSRKAECVKKAYLELTKNDQESVLVHLKRMSDEPGWHTEQRLSAQFALQFLENF